MRYTLLLFFVACAGASRSPDLDPGYEVGLVPPASAAEPPGTGADPPTPIATWPDGQVICASVGTFPEATNIALYPTGIIVFDLDGAPTTATTDHCLIIRSE